MKLALRRRSRRTPCPRQPWRLERLEDRAVPAIAYAVGSGAGMPSQVRVFDQTGNLLAQIPNVYPNFSGGVSVAVGDYNKDGTPDIVTGAGPGGGPHVKVYDGAALLAGTVTELRSFFAYGTEFLGGVNVAIGDFNGDQTADVVTGVGPGGGPHVKVFSGTNNSVLASFFAYDATFAGGVTVAAGDFGGDNGGVAGSRNGSTEIATGAGPGGGPHVKVFAFNASTNSKIELLGQFMAFDTSFHGGVTVGSGFITNNRDASNFLYADLVVSAGGGGGPHVKVWRLLDVIPLPGGGQRFVYFAAASYFAFASTFSGGVSTGISAADLNGDGNDDIIVGQGPGDTPTVDARAGKAIGDEVTFNPAKLFDKAAFDAGFTGGIYVG
jgi:hypothetical protein